jgi:hypothetical protein
MARDPYAHHAGQRPCYHAPHAKNHRASAVLCSRFACAQTSATTTPPPVIDIHVHAFDSLLNVGPMFPFPAQFTASDAKAGTERKS